MLDKYVVVGAREIIAKQSSNGVWYCSELPAKDTKDLEAKIGEVNRILNTFNVEAIVKRDSRKKEKKEKNKNNDVGLKA